MVSYSSIEAYSCKYTSTLKKYSKLKSPKLSTSHRLVCFGWHNIWLGQKLQSTSGLFSNIIKASQWQQGGRIKAIEH